jgi:hypothetical protein
LKTLPEEYFVSIYITLVGVMGAIIFFALLFLFVNVLFSAIVFYGGIIVVVAIGIFLYNYPIVVASTRGNEIDAAIPYLLPYMKILAKELTLARLFLLLMIFLFIRRLRRSLRGLSIIQILLVMILIVQFERRWFHVLRGNLLI